MGVPKLLSSCPLARHEAPKLMWPHALRRDPALAERPDLVEHMEAFQLISDNSTAWDPEPAVVAWARLICEDRESTRGSRSGSRGYAPRPLGTTFPHLALERLDAVLAAGASVNAPGFSGETALHLVAHKMRTSTDRESQQLAQLAWHHLVERGAESLAVDVDGATPLDRLSRQQCRGLLETKRKTYSAKRYERARLQGHDPALAWSTEDSARSSAFTMTPRPAVVLNVLDHVRESPRSRPRPGSARGLQPDSPTTSTGRFWAESLRTPRTGSRLDLVPRSPKTPRILQMSLESVSPPSSPGRTAKEKVYFTPPTRFLPSDGRPPRTGERR